MISKFDQIFNKIVTECSKNKNIVSENINIAAIQELIDAEDKNTEITRKNFIRPYIDTLLRFSHAYAEDNQLTEIEAALKDMTKKYIYGRKKITDLYPVGNYTEKNILNNLVDIISSQYGIEQSELRRVFEDTMVKNARTFSIFNFTPQRKSPLLRKVLSYIDTNNITDNDVITITPDEFNAFVKDNNNFSYAIFVNNNKIVGCAEVNEKDRTINAFTNHLKISTPIKSILNKTDKVIIILKKVS